MPSCVETFADLAADDAKSKQKSDIIAAEHPGCVCEVGSVAPEVSPGRVEDQELLIRSIYSPHQYERDTGELKPTAFDDVVDKGLSVDRKSHTSSAQIRQQIEAKLQAAKSRGAEHKFEGVAVLPCRAAREMVHGTERVFGVYDTATTVNRAHADVCQVRHGTKLEQRKARLALVNACRHGLVPETDLDTIFDAADLPGHD